MKITAFAPHLAGRMLPGFFSTMPDFKKPRFPGDPWPLFPHVPRWTWMCTTECGLPNHVGKSTDKRYMPHWREVERPAPLQLPLI